MIKTQSELQQEFIRLCENEGQRQLADRLGLSEAYVSQIVSGNREVSKRVARAMGYQPLHQPRPEKIYSPV
jgi:transcriptional regulator with XRE-family HTH domain